MSSIGNATSDNQTSTLSMKEQVAQQMAKKKPQEQPEEQIETLAQPAIEQANCQYCLQSQMAQQVTFTSISDPSSSHRDLLTERCAYLESVVKALMQENWYLKLQLHQLSNTPSSSLRPPLNPHHYQSNQNFAPNRMIRTADVIRKDSVKVPNTRKMKEFENSHIFLRTNIKSILSPEGLFHGKENNRWAIIYLSKKGRDWHFKHYLRQENGTLGYSMAKFRFPLDKSMFMYVSPISSKELELLGIDLSKK